MKKNRCDEFKIGDLVYVSVKSYRNGWPCRIPLASNGMILAKIIAYDDTPMGWEPLPKHHKDCSSCNCPAYNLNNIDDRIQYEKDKDYQENFRVRHPWTLIPADEKYSWATLIAKPEWLKKYPD